MVREKATSPDRHNPCPKLSYARELRSQKQAFGSTPHFPLCGFIVNQGNVPTSVDRDAIAGVFDLVAGNRQFGFGPNQYRNWEKIKNEKSHECIFATKAIR